MLSSNLILVIELSVLQTSPSYSLAARLTASSRHSLGKSSLKIDWKIFYIKIWFWGADSTEAATSKLRLNGCEKSEII